MWLVIGIFIFNDESIMFAKAEFKELLESFHNKIQWYTSFNKLNIAFSYQYIYIY